MENAELKTLEDKVDDILTLLKGNALNNEDKGVVGIVNDLKARVNNLEKWRDRGVWMLIGIGLPASVGIIEILQKIFIK